MPVLDTTLRFKVKLKRKYLRKPLPPRDTRSERRRMQRMALVRHAMTGEDMRKKAPITLPKLKFLEEK